MPEGVKTKGCRAPHGVTLAEDFESILSAARECDPANLPVLIGALEQAKAEAWGRLNTPVVPLSQETKVQQASADEEVELEAASGLEPERRGFAERMEAPDQRAPNPVKLDDPGF